MGVNTSFFLKYCVRACFSRSDSCDIQPLATRDQVCLDINGFLKRRTSFFFLSMKSILYINCEVTEPIYFYSSSVPPMRDCMRRFFWLLSGSRGMLPCVCMTQSEPAPWLLAPSLGKLVLLSPSSF